MLISGLIIFGHISTVIHVVFYFVSPFVPSAVVVVLDLRLVMLNKIVTRSSAREKGCQEKLCVLRSAFELKLKKLVDYDTICTCQVGLSVVSSCCLFSLSVSLLFSFISIIILYTVFLTVSVLFPFSLLFSSFLYFISISLLFSYIVYPVLFFPFILFYHLSLYLVSVMVISLSLPVLGVV
ncbi:hypothetical protein BD560DRAFT_124574 [Blakeslea trispora]|nr:hypothetical protein BD560DRAFT_124574 [Blakeslea trispora]